MYTSMGCDQCQNYVFQNSVAVRTFRNRGDTFRNRGYTFRNRGYTFRNGGYTFRNRVYTFHNRGYTFRNRVYTFRNRVYTFRNRGYTFRNRVVIGATLGIIGGLLFIIGSTLVVIGATLFIIGCLLFVIGSTLFVIGATLFIIGGILFVIGSTLFVIGATISVVIAVVRPGVIKIGGAKAPPGPPLATPLVLIGLKIRAPTALIRPRGGTRCSWMASQNNGNFRQQAVATANLLLEAASLLESSQSTTTHAPQQSPRQVTLDRTLRRNGGEHAGPSRPSSGVFRGGVWVFKHPPQGPGH